MKIAARFHCHSAERFADHEVVKLQPVYSSKEGTVNHDWSQYTPSGKIEMSITAKGAIGQFKPGKEYHLIFTEVAEEAPAAA